jgi:uncharacterized protein with HEPN domain
MRRDVRAYLWDVQQAADAISKFSSGLDLAAYSRSELVQSAIERKFEIIGEALSQLSKIDADLATRIPNCAQIIAFRNILIHGYAAIQQERVWRVVEVSLPELRRSVALLLDELGA